MKWTQAYKYYFIYSLTLVAMFGIVTGLLIYPAFHKIISIKQEISKEKSDLEAKLNMGLNAKRIKEELDGIENSLQNLDTVFIKQGEELNLLSSFEAIANKHQVTLSIKPDFNGQAINGIVKIPMELKANGNFNNLMSFANDLDTTAFYFVTDNLSLKKNEKDLELTLTGQTYLKASTTKTKR